MNKLVVLTLIAFALIFTPSTQAATLFPFPSIPSFPFPSVNPFPSSTPAPSSLPTPSFFPSPSKTPNPSLELGLIDPSTANFAQTVTLKGHSFGSAQGSVIFFQRYSQTRLASAPILSWSDTEIKFTVPGLAGNSYYDVAVERSNSTVTNKLKFQVKYGEPVISSISIIRNSQGITLQLGGTEFGSSRGSVNFYNSSNSLVGVGTITSWLSNRVYLKVPTNLPTGQYSYQLKTSDGRLSALHFLNI